MAKDVARLTNIIARPHSALSRVPSVSSAAIRSHPQCSLQSQRSFSQIVSLSLPRHRPNRDNYPGFRNESKERRNVREHNLFDPQLRHSESTSDANDPHGYAQPVTRPPGTLPLDQSPLSEIERELLYLSSRFPTDTRARNALLNLIYNKLQPPNAVQYEALIFANASAEYGCAENLQNLIQEMEEMEIPFNVNLYCAILRTLVIHPDTGILNRVIEACENQWIEIDSEMRHLICAAYLRAGMPEIALEHLERLESWTAKSALGVTRSGVQRGQAELWLYVLFIDHLAALNDWEGVMRVCYRLCDDTSYGIPLASRHLDIPYSFWHSVLEKASVAKDKWVTFWIWESWVLKAWVRPSPETCLQVLEICAQSGAICTAETACMILRFLSKETTERDAGHEAESQRPFRQHIETANTLLSKTYDNADPNEPRPSQADIRRITAEWWMFDVEDTIGLDLVNKEPRRSLRINPWAVLRENNDPGRSWARKVDEREAVLRKREEREALRKANIRRAKIEAGHAAMRRSLPPQLLADIEKAASAELDDNETENKVPIQPPDSEHIQDKDGKDKKKEKKPAPFRIRLIDHKNRDTSQSVQNARIKSWVSLGLDPETALKMDGRKGHRAWTIKGDDSEEVPKPDHTTDHPSESSLLPKVRLSKLPEISRDEGWYPEWAEMWRTRRKYEKAVRRKRNGMPAIDTMRATESHTSRTEKQVAYERRFEPPTSRSTKLQALPSEITEVETSGCHNPSIELPSKTKG